MSARVTVVGSLNMDLVIRSPRIPQPGETIIGHEFYAAPGGKGANQAVAAARLGARASMIGRVGQDPFADQLLESLAADRVDHASVLQDPEATTGVALIVVDDTGQNSIVVASGANMRLSPADVERAESTIARSHVLLLQLETPLDAVARAAEIAHAHDVAVILNPAPARPLPADLLTLVDLLVPNESETALLTGMPMGNEAEAVAAVGTLQEYGVRAVIVTLGERGALLAQASGVEVFPAFEVEPVDTTAAGDAFVAGLAVALAEGRTLGEAVRWGNAAGALATIRPGAQPSLPTRQALAEMLATGTLRSP